MLSKNTKPRRKKCKQCEKLYEPKSSFQSTCSPVCAIEYTKDKQNRKEVFKSATEADIKEVKGRLRQLGKSDRSKALRAAQKAFNAFIRERDKDLPCVSCGRHHDGQYHAGHYKPKGSNPELAFCEINVWKQCSVCNNHLSGNLTNYRIELVNRIGIEKVEWIEGPHEPKKYTVDELWQIENQYKQKLKELQGD